MKHPKRDEQMTFKPAGLALAAVVAGLSAAKADPVDNRAAGPLEPTAHAQTYVADPTNAPGYGEDEEMIVGPSEPVAPFSNR
ncbi:MAG: hypothetical protein QM759_04415 [Terricaulis sp.]